MSGSGFKIILNILGFSVISFLLFHLFSVVGIFITAGYLIWWLLFPQKTWCFSCRMRKVGEKCSWCSASVKNENQRYPKSLRSVFLNTLLLLGITLLSLAVVFGETQIMKKLGFAGPPKTALFSLPTQRQYQTLEIFPLKIEVSDLRTPINAVQVDLSFDSTKLQLVNVDLEESFASIFVEKEIDNEQGRFRISGGLPNPGFSGEKGTFVTVYFQGIAPGPAQVTFLPSSLVMANDGKGSNVLNEYQTINYLILSQRLSETEQNLQYTTLGPAVLGTQSATNKLIFYDENAPITIPHVLGATSNDSSKKTALTIFRFWFNLNEALLGYWSNLLRLS